MSDYEDEEIPYTALAEGELSSILLSSYCKNRSSKLRDILLDDDPVYICAFWSMFNEALINICKENKSLETLEQYIQLYKECCSSNAELIKSFNMNAKSCLENLSSIVQSQWYEVDHIYSILLTFQSLWVVSGAEKFMDIKKLVEDVRTCSDIIPELKAYWRSAADDSPNSTPTLLHKCVFTTFIEAYKEALQNEDNEQQKNLRERFLGYFETSDDHARNGIIWAVKELRIGDLIVGNQRDVAQMRCRLKMEEKADLKFSKPFLQFTHDSLIDDTPFLIRGGQASVKCVKVHGYPVKMVAKMYENDGTIDMKSCRNEIFGLMDCGSHPHIVTIFGIIEKLQVPIGFLMEYCEDGSLHDAIYDKAYEYNDSHIISWSMQAASALIFLHERNIIHRDIKPKNMLLSNERKLLQVSDLGLIKLHPQSTRYPTTAGTLKYTAPELRKIPDYEDDIVEANVDKRVLLPEADIYSLGASIYEMINKVMPPKELWKQKSLKRVKAKVHVRSSLNKLMTEMIRKFPKTRPNATEVYEALEKLNEEQILNV